MKILIAEDDFFSRKYLEDMLTLENYECIAAKNGEEALELNNKHNPELIITDIQMPKLSGLELLEEIRKKKSDVIIIMTTAYGSEEFAIRALQGGANNYLKKPINEEQLIRLLQKYEQVISKPAGVVKKAGKILTKNFTIEYNISENNIREIVEHLVFEIDDLFDASEKINIELGLLEMITNAFEHGNLEITYDQKQEALDDNKFEQLIQDRLTREDLANRKITVDYIYDSTGCEWRIIDEGKGFDWKAVPDPVKDTLLELNGRGIFITKFLFDEFEYFGKGNIVRVKKYFW